MTVRGSPGSRMIHAVMADRTRDLNIVAFAQRQVTLTDWVFTFGGVVLVAVGGIGNAVLNGIPMTTLWLALGNGLFALSGLICIAVLIPLHIKLARMAKGFSAAAAIPKDYWKLEQLSGDCSVGSRRCFRSRISS